MNGSFGCVESAGAAAAAELWGAPWRPGQKLGRRISIGEAAQVFGLTARAIRFYEEKGLIVSRRDRDNWRCFDPEAQARLATISICRKLGLPLSEICELLNPATPLSERKQRIAEILRRRQARLAKELETLEAVLAELEDERSAADAAPRLFLPDGAPAPGDPTGARPARNRTPFGNLAG